MVEYENYVVDAVWYEKRRVETVCGGKYPGLYTVQTSKGYYLESLVDEEIVIERGRGRKVNAMLR